MTRDYDHDEKAITREPRKRERHDERMTESQREKHDERAITRET